jgi:hypothetical protein
VQDTRVGIRPWSGKDRQAFEADGFDRGEDTQAIEADGFDRGEA